jgi:molecular chaperone DnaK
VLALVALGVTLAFVLFRPQAPQQVAEHHYRFTVPDGWQRTGGNEAVRQVNVGPLDSSFRPDRIIVKEVELSYDASSDADRARAVGELHADYEQRRAATDPPSFDGFDETASFAGRDVLYYSEVVSAGTVDWYVVFGGRFQVSVGCQHDEVGAERVRTACARVLGTLTVETQGS